MTNNNNTNIKDDTAVDDTSDLQGVVREWINSRLCADLKDQHGVENVLRVVQQQASFMLQTERCRDCLTNNGTQDSSDQQQNDQAQTRLHKLSQLLHVVDYHSVQTMNGYSRIEAVLQIDADQVMRTKGSVQSNIQLHFCYEKETQQGQPVAAYTGPYDDDDDGCSSTAIPIAPTTTVRYAIDLAKDYGPREECLCVQIFAYNPYPSPFPPQFLFSKDMGDIIDDDDDDDGWEDISDNGNENDKQEDSKNSNADIKEGDTKRSLNIPLSKKGDKSKRPKLEDLNHIENLESAVKDVIDEDNSDNNGDDDDDDAKDDHVVNGDVMSGSTDEYDQYIAEADPEILARFVKCTQLGSKMAKDPASVMLLLLSFPFYENEWDIVGLIMQGVFGSDTDSEDESNDNDDDDSKDYSDNAPKPK